MALYSGSVTLVVSRNFKVRLVGTLGRNYQPLINNTRYCVSTKGYYNSKGYVMFITFYLVPDLRFLDLKHYPWRYPMRIHDPLVLNRNSSLIYFVLLLVPVSVLLLLTNSVLTVCVTTAFPFLIMTYAIDWRRFLVISAQWSLYMIARNTT